jgi:hypothetical protein
MNTDIQRLLERWLFDPLTGKLVFVVIGLLVSSWLPFACCSRTGVVQQRQFHALPGEKGRDLFGYAPQSRFVALVFSDKLGGLTVAFGVAGAASPSPCRKSSPASQLGGRVVRRLLPGRRPRTAGRIKGDVMTSGCCAPPSCRWASG